jgi:hypothetical protein
LSNVIVDEEYGTQYEKSRGGLLKKRRRFCAFANYNFDAYIKIRNFIVSNYSESIESLTVTEEDETSRLWHGECTFSPPDTKEVLKEQNLPEYSFSTKGGTAHITQSRKTVQIYRGWRPKYKYVEDKDGKKKLEIVKKENGKIDLEKEEIQDHHGGIGWNEESASYDGTDIIVPAWKSTVKITVPNDFIDPHYLKMLRLMTGSVNGLPFDGMNRGECLFMGCDGNRRLQEVKQQQQEGGSENESEPEMELVWDLTFEFVGAPNRRTWIDNIGYVNKRGWEYMHMLRRMVNAPYVITQEDIPKEEEGNHDNEDFTTDDDVANTETQNTPAPTEGSKKTHSTPVAAYIEQVYPYADFRMLGFNSIVS